MSAPALTPYRSAAPAGHDGFASGGPYPMPGYRQSGDGLVVTGSGDIAPVPPSGEGSVAGTLIGAFAGLIAMVVVAVMFITAEYRRGLIRVTLTASPRRSRILAAKAIVAGVAAFAVGLPAAVASLLIEEPLARSRGIFIYPVPVLTEVRVIAGTAALLAVAAVLALALGAVLRRSAIAVTAVIAVVVLPYFFAIPLALLPAGTAAAVRDSATAIGVVLGLLYLFPIVGAVLGGSHLARLIQQTGPMTAGLAIQATTGLRNLPISPWAGLGVLAAWAAGALLAGALLLRLRDA